MRYRLFLAMQVCCLALLAGCQKEEASSGAIQLTTEGFHGEKGDKTSVSDLSVQWVNGDQVRLNDGTYTVAVNDGKAYVNGGSLIGKTVYGYSPASLEGISWDGDNKRLSFDFPSTYSCSYEGGRQKIDLPMAAYVSTAGEAIPFRHLTAAVKVMVRNDISGTTLTLDSVVVSSTEYKLSGSATATLAVGTAPSIAAESGSGKVKVLFSERPTLAENCTTEVQVPIRPIGASNLTIEVYAHRQADAIAIAGVPAVYKSVVYHFSATNTSAALDRNKILTARISLKNTTPSSEVDNSLFSVSSSQRVHFSQGNLKHTTDGWSFHTNQSDYLGGSQTDAARDLFGWGTGNAPNSTDGSDANYSSYNEWGANSISYGTGTVDAGWRTLTSTEWSYLLSRTNTTYGLPAGTNSSSATYTKASVDEKNGIILFPDNYAHPSGVTISGDHDYNDPAADYSSFVVTSGWNLMEAAGAIFLPAGGYRDGTTPASAGGEGNYWASTNSGGDKAYRLEFKSNELTTSNPIGRHYGYSVRLVKNAN